MKNISLIILTAAFGLFLLNSNATAGYLDSGWQNITQYDGLSKSPTSDWHSSNEDHEVEPGATTGQNWDMEGFYLSDGTVEAENALTMVGGYNFVTGVPGYPSGDIFIDIDSGTESPSANDSDYWEYILDLDFATGSYTVYENTGTTVINKTYGGPGGTAGYAWTYGSGGSKVSYNGAYLENLALNYATYSTDSAVGDNLTGGWHNKVTVDVAFLGPDTGFKAWSTMRCGNDMLFSEGTTSAAVPEPATLFLLGSGLLGLFGYRKKFRKTDK
jgi:hypothetical protein